MKGSIFELDGETMELLAELQVSTRSTSNTQVIEKALILLNEVAEASKQNKQTFLVDKQGNQTEIII